MTDEEVLRRWIRAIAEGDPRPMKPFFEATRGYVRGLLQSMLTSRDALEEVLVDTYLRVWKRAASYEPGRGSVRLWLGALARHRAIDHLRARGRERVETTDPELLEEVSATGPSPLQATEGDERASSLHRAVEHLSERQRVALDAVFFQGLTHVQAAESLGLPLGTIKGRVRAALGHLRRDLGLLEEGTG